MALDALLRHSTLTGAARSVNLSQPAMSMTLKRLRETFGDELVRYHRGGTTYTALGDDLRPRIADILERSWGLIDLARGFDPGSYRGTITVSAPQSTLGFFYAPLVAALAMTAPNLAIRAVPYTPATTASDHIDLYILPRWLASPHVPSRTLFIDEFSCLVPPAYPWAVHMDEDAYLSRFHAALPAGEEELFWPEDSSARNLLTQRRIQARASQLDALRFLVVHDDMIATVPSRLAHQSGAMSLARPMNAPPALVPVEMVVQAPDNRGDEPALRWMMGEMVRLAMTFNPPEAVAYPGT